MKKLFVLFLTLCLVFGNVSLVQAQAGESVVVLFENDVHCAIDGYAKLSAMKQELAQTYDYVGVVSVGDYIQGSSLGAVSQGAYIVGAMNLVGYDAVTLGNHEFDYKLPRLLALTEQMDCKPVCCNFQKIGENTSVFQPYSVVSYGSVDVAYVGVTTPDTMTSSSPAQFLDEQGQYLYTFHGTDLYQTVQNSIDAAKADGADYVVALTHLGTEDVHEQWSSIALVQNTRGLDVVLDGHSHSVVEQMKVSDLDGEEVPIASTGTKFAYIGQLTIEKGEVSTKLIPTESYRQEDPSVRAYVEKINEEYAVLGNRKIGESKVDLTTADKDGNRLVRHAETNLGDFCADAYRAVTGADIGLQNGGGIRADMAAGEITFNDILSVFPFNNTVCVVELTGGQIADLLELGVANHPNEDGTFQQVSGITFELDSSVESSVVLDENKVFVKVDGPRRVKNLKVWDKQTQTYQPIDENKSYTVASHNYLLLDGGGGASMVKNAKVIRNDGLLDVELLELYITQHLGGGIGLQYERPQGRIQVVDGTQSQPADKEPQTQSDLPQQEDLTVPKTGDAVLLWAPAMGLTALGCLLLLRENRME